MFATATYTASDPAVHTAAIRAANVQRWPFLVASFRQR